MLDSSLAELQAALVAKKVSSVELAKACHARIRLSLIHISEPTRH